MRLLQLKEIARRRSEPWERPLVVKVNRGAWPEYYYHESALPPLDAERYSRQSSLGQP